MSIRKLNEKEPIDGLLTLDGSDLNDASTTTKGVVQIGNGLSVADGVVSVPSKKFITAYLRTTDQDVIVGSDLIFNTYDSNSTINIDTNTGVFTLESGKFYLINVHLRFTFSGDTGYCRYGVYSVDSGIYPNPLRGLEINPAITNGRTSTGGLTQVVNGTTHPRITIRCDEIGSNSTVTLMRSFSHITIVEL